MFGKRSRSSGPYDWQTNPKLAYEEAVTRIRGLSHQGKDFSPRNQLYGGLELFLSDLEALEELPIEISQLKGLKALFIGRAELQGQKYAGATKIRDLSVISSLKDLEYLSISGTSVVDLAPLRTLANLRELDMERTPVRNLSDLEALNSLREVYLAGSKVIDVAPLARLPATSRGEAVRFGIKNIPALKQDPRLNLLARLGTDQNSDEIIQYLKGQHPAFTDKAQASTGSPVDRLATASPVRFHILDGKIEATNQDDFPLIQIEERSAQLSALRSHVADLLEESQTKQIPDDLLRRLVRYEDRLRSKDPLYISLDGPMSFLRGALGDDYVREATDKGFVSGCEMLISMHDSLRRNFIRNDLENELEDRTFSESDADLLYNIVESTISAVSHEELINDLGHSVVEATEALRGYSEAARKKTSNQVLLSEAL